MSYRKLVMKNESNMIIFNNVQSQQNQSNNWIFFIGLIVSCVGETMLLSYVVFSPDNILITGFAVGLVLLAIGNLTMLLEYKIRMRILKS